MAEAFFILKSVETKEVPVGGAGQCFVYQFKNAGTLEIEVDGVVIAPGDSRDFFGSKFSVKNNKGVEAKVFYQMLSHFNSNT